MAVDLTAADLMLDVAGLTDRSAARLLAVATERVQRYAPSAPTVMQNEAAIRFIGYLVEAGYGGVRNRTVGPLTVERVTNHAAAFRNCGASSLLTQYKVRRGGVIGESTIDEVIDPPPTVIVLATIGHLTSPTVNEIAHGTFARITGTGDLTLPTWTTQNFYNFIGVPTGFEIDSILYAGNDLLASGDYQRWPLPSEGQTWWRSTLSLHFSESGRVYSVTVSRE